MPFCTINSETIFYAFNRSKAEKSILLIHGSGGNHTLWPEKLVHSPDVCVYAVDLPGHGLSKGHGRSSIKEYADFIDSFILHLDLKNIMIAGHSMGGAIAQIIALNPPEWLSGIILIGTGARLRVAPFIFEGVLSDFRETVNLIYKLAFGPAASRQIVDIFLKSFLDNGQETVLNDFKACDNFDILKEIGNINLPTLVLSGSKDQLTPIKYGEFLCGQIPGAAHMVIDDAGHMMALEKPDEFVRHVMDFLKRVNI